MKLLKLAALVSFVLLVFVVPVMAQQNIVSGTLDKDANAAYAGDRGAANFYGNAIAAGIGSGLILIGAGLGFGRIGSAALESMARQPEVAGRVQTAMLIIAALLEGATFFGLIVCIIMSTKA